MGTGIVAIWRAPDISDDVGRRLAYAPASSVLPATINILIGVIAAWLIVGISCGLLMENQPWYRNLYLVVPIVFYMLLTPAVR